MGFRHPATSVVDQVARDAAALAGIPQNTLETAASGPRIVVEQIDAPDYDPGGAPVEVVDATIGRVRMESSNGNPGELSLTTSQLVRRLLLSAGTFRPDGTGDEPAPYFAMSYTKTETPPFAVRAAAIGDVDYFAVPEVRAGVVVVGSAPPSASHAVRRDWIDARLQGGSAVFTFPAALTTYSQTVTFAQSMPSVPAVVVTAVANDPHNVSLSIGGLSNTGFTLYGRRAAGTGSTGVRWVATSL